MPTKEDLQQAIETLENQEASFETCHKLAAYNYLLEKYYGKLCEMPENFYRKIRTDYTSDSEFMTLALDTSTDDLLTVMDELMGCVAVINPKLYNSVLDKLRAH